jgi:hypothetical protein
MADPKVMPELPPEPPQRREEGTIGAIEEGGKVAVGTIEALKSQPLALALVIVNVLFLLTGGYFLHDLKSSVQERNQRHDEQFSTLLERCVGRSTEQKSQ